tara:strand:- start:19907 stop:20452 length:546 start_codon:yes stop_codon:yes gene_type:complete
MYNELIELDKEGNVLMQDKTILLMPKLFEVYKHKRMGSDMVRWIVCIADYKSPYRRLPEQERVRTVTYSIFNKYKNSNCEDDIVLDALHEYKQLQYEPLMDQYNAMSEQMYRVTQVYREIVPTQSNLEDLNDIAIKMEKAALARDKIKALILKDQQSEAKISGTSSDNFSMIENKLRIEDN